MILGDLVVRGRKCKIGKSSTKASASIFMLARLDLTPLYTAMTALKNNLGIISFSRSKTSPIYLLRTCRDTRLEMPSFAYVCDRLFFAHHVCHLRVHVVNASLVDFRTAIAAGITDDLWIY